MADEARTEEESSREGESGRRFMGLIHSFRNAGRGVSRTISTQRNMKIHTVSAVMVMIVGMSLPFGLASRVALLFCVALVFFAEILNSALEAFVDLHVKSFHKQAMAAKDAAAAGVLVLAIATVVILAAIMHFEWEMIFSSPDAVLRSVGFGLPLTIGVVLLLWWVRSTAPRILLALATLLLAIPLVIYGSDPIFAVCLVGLILLSAVSRPA